MQFTKIFFSATCLISFQFAFAGVEIQKGSSRYGTVMMKLTGEEAQLIKALSSGYDGKADMYLQKGAAKEDVSNIRSVNCASEVECTIVYDAEVLTNKDQQDFYGKAFNEKLKSMSVDQALIMPTMGKGGGNETPYDARVLRLLMENPSGMKGISIQSFRPSAKTTGEVVSSRLYEVQVKTKSMKLTCFSSIITGMGVQNFLEETCSIEAIAQQK